VSVTLIEIPQWGSATLIEVIWLLSGLLAFVFTNLRLPSLWHDYRDTTEMHEEDLCLIARGYLRREAIRLLQSICIVSIGLYSVSQDPATPGAARVSIAGLILTAGLIMVSLLVAAQSYLDWRDREDVRRIITRREE
jgi:hypothetical protein